jgi:hypothetical protein
MYWIQKAPDTTKKTGNVGVGYAVSFPTTVIYDYVIM